MCLLLKRQKLPSERRKQYEKNPDRTLQLISICLSARLAKKRLHIRKISANVHLKWKRK